MKKMKIWMINHYAGSVEFGMEFRHYYFARELVLSGHEVTVIAGSYSHLRKYNPSVSGPFAEEIHDGIRYVWIPTRVYEGNGVARALSMLDFYRRSVRNLKRIGTPDLILSSSPHLFACLAGIKMAKRSRCKNISEVRDLWPEALVYYKGLSDRSLFVKALEHLEHKIYRKSDAIIFTKPGDIDYLKEKKWLDSFGGDVHEKKCHYLNNGVDLETFDEQMHSVVYPELPESDKDSFTVTYVGTIRDVNNIDMLLDAAKLLLEKENVKFRIYGDGEALQRLRERAKNEKITNVFFGGRVDKKYIPNILSRSSVNILNYSPSKYNWSRGNSSNKLFEYMACGKPIIATVKMGYSPIVEYDCGMEIGDCDGQKLAQAITEICSATSERISQMGQNARNAAKYFDYKILARKLADIIMFTENGGE